MIHVLLSLKLTVIQPETVVWWRQTAPPLAAPDATTLAERSDKVHVHVQYDPKPRYTLLDFKFRRVNLHDFVTDFKFRGVNFRADFNIREFFRRKKCSQMRESNVLTGTLTITATWLPVG